jgi:hypothetical protein
MKEIVWGVGARRRAARVSDKDFDGPGPAGCVRCGQDLGSRDLVGGQKRHIENMLDKTCDRRKQNKFLLFIFYIVEIEIVGPILLVSQ